MSDRQAERRRHWWAGGVSAVGLVTNLGAAAYHYCFLTSGLGYFLSVLNGFCAGMSLICLAYNFAELRRLKSPVS